MSRRTMLAVIAVCGAVALALFAQGPRGTAADFLLAAIAAIGGFAVIVWYAVVTIDRRMQ